MKFIRVLKAAQFKFNEDDEKEVKNSKQANEFIFKGIKENTKGLNGGAFYDEVDAYLMFLLAKTTNEYIRNAAKEYRNKLGL